MFTVSIEMGFLASHQLVLSDDSKEPSHRHNWVVTADVSSARLNSIGLVIDFRRFKTLLRNIIDELNDTSLEKLSYFQQNNPSAEVIAKYIYEKLEPELPKGVKLEAIRVVEEPGCTAKFSK